MKCSTGFPYADDGTQDTLKVLSIGNSFSQDAQRWLYAIASDEGRKIECVNLYIGGCSLKRHWENVSGNRADYMTERNGLPDVDRTVSAGEIVSLPGWDVVTLQQVSHESGQFETYLPYLYRMAEWIRDTAPGATVVLQQTWAYENDSTHSEFRRYDNSQSVMYSKLRRAYLQASEYIQAPLIPVGDVIQALRALPEFDCSRGGRSLCRDGFHLSLGLGRYAAAAAWYLFLFGRPIRGSFAPEGLTEEELGLIPLILKTAERIVLGE